MVFSGDEQSFPAPVPARRRPGSLHYSESDPTDPVTVYGKTMVSAEQLLADWMPTPASLRISLPMGISFNGHAGAIDWIQSRFKKGRPATLYFDEVRTPAYTDCLNRLYERVLATDLCGVYHAGGPRPLSLYEIAQVINRVGGYDPNLLMGCPRIEAGPIPPRAGNVTMDSRALAEALGDEEPLDALALRPRLRPHGSPLGITIATASRVRPSCWTAFSIATRGARCSHNSSQRLTTDFTDGNG